MEEETTGVIRECGKEITSKRFVLSTHSLLLTKCFKADELEVGTSVLHYKESLTALRTTHPFGKVLFSTYIQKFNRFNKSSLRILLFTDRYIAKLDSKKFKVMKEPVPLQNVTFILTNETNIYFSRYRGSPSVQRQMDWSFSM